MQESKYYYNEVPLSEYCRENDMNIKTIRTRIWKKKNNPKYSQYTEQQIINMVVETYGSGTKYMWGEMSLRKYCLNNEINYETITSRIEKLKKENPSLSNDELVIAALEEYQNKNYRFFYKGIPLKDYCEKHPEINYGTIRSFINRELGRNPNLSIEDTIELYILKEHKGRYKYYYCGMPLIHYCKENNINYYNIITYIKRHKKESIDVNLSDDEYIEIIMDQYEPFELTYSYKGLSLRQYCLQNSLSYYGIITYVKRKRNKKTNLDINDLIEEAINTVNRYGIIYYYNGIPLKDYCKEHQLNIDSIRSSIIRKKNTTDTPLQEIVNECVENYKEFTVKYFYEGKPLYSYCKKIGLSYATVLSAYEEKRKLSNQTTEEIIKEIVDYYIQNPPIRTKYYVTDDKTESLRNFCNKNGYSYLAIYLRMKSLEQKEIFEEKEKCMMYAIEKYERKLQIQKINNLFEELKQRKKMNDVELKELCKTLKINYDNVKDLVGMEFSLNQAINIIWFFSDRKDNNDNKLISDKKLIDIFDMINQIKSANATEIMNFGLYDLIGIYKSELYDTRTAMLIRQQKYFKKIIWTLCQEYNLKLTKDNFEEFENEIKTYFIIAINRLHLNTNGQIIKYIDLTIKGYFRTYLKKQKQQITYISLDENKFKNEKGTNNAKTRLDYIEDKKYDNVNGSVFSDKMMTILKTLSPDDFSFIVLKFQEEYSDEELANYFQTNIEKVKETEMRILSLLKDNPNVQILKKKL
ncbi:MAG: hypothetical protein ACI31M_04130 [Bacilli bacterium]